MLRSYHMFTIFGIPIRVHWSLIALLLLFGLFLGMGEGILGFLVTVFVLGLIFGFVLLHELGHSVVALHHGIPVRQITLYFLGGVASLGQLPRNPRIELQVAIAGPVVNFLLAGLFFLLALLVPGGFFEALLTVNLVLGLFNLLPAFPLDGGRILRALLATRLPYEAATRIAARIGQGMAFAIGFFGLLTVHLMLIPIAFFVYFAAQAELLAVSLRGHAGLMEAFLRGTHDLDGRARYRVNGFWNDEPRDDSGRNPWQAASGSERPPPAGGGDCVVDIGPDGSVRKVWRRVP